MLNGIKNKLQTSSIETRTLQMYKERRLALLDAIMPFYLQVENEIR